jgi:hypothetical protein
MQPKKSNANITKSYIGNKRFYAQKGKGSMPTALLSA